MGGTRDGTRPGTRRLTQREAAEALGISVEAIKKRVKRGSLPSEMGEDGKRYVYLDASLPHDGDASGAMSDSSGEATDLLYEQMRERISYLEHQVEEEREARRRADMLLARLVERVPELEAPASPEPAEPRSSEARPTPAREAEGAGEHRSWWARWFGGG